MADEQKQKYRAAKKIIRLLMNKNKNIKKLEKINIIT